MRKMMALAAVAAVLLAGGCASSIKTTFTQNNESGKLLASGTTSIAGWSDKVFESAGEGMFVDMAKGSEGAGLKKASTKVEGSGFAETFKGIGDMMGGMAMLMAQMQGGGFINGGGGNTGGGNVSGGNVSGGNVSGGPAQVALPDDDAVWIICGPNCSRCNTLKRNLRGVTEVSGLPIRFATEGESQYFNALLRVAYSCQTGNTIAYPYVILVRGGNRDCIGRLMTLTEAGLKGAVDSTL